MASVAIAIIAAHLIGDFAAQPHWMAIGKLNDWRIRTAHVALYTLWFIPVVWLARLPLTMAIAFLVLVYVTHWLTDCRRWASAKLWPPKPIMVDQAIHVATLAIIAAAFGL